MLLSVVSSLATPASVARAASPLERWAFYVTYDPSSRASLTQQIHQLDHVIPDYYGLTADGSIVGTDDAAVDAIVVGAGARLLPLVQNRLRGHDLTPLLANTDLRHKAVTSISDLAQRYGYDGITLDFEGVDPGDRSAMTTFVQELARGLHDRHRDLVVAVPAKSGDLSAGWAGAFDYMAIGAAADRVILMAYAYRTAANRVPGPISPLPWVQEVTQYALSSIPANRLVVGIGAWGYDWNLSAPGRAKTLAYLQSADLAAHYRQAIVFDPVVGAASFAYQVSGQSHQVWLEDAASVRQKIELASHQGDAGVAVWRLGQEPPGIWNASETGSRPDFGIPNGWFFSETGGDTGLGYRVTDDNGVRFWSEFQRLGGVATLGYPSSQRFTGPDGFTYQAFQRGILQWRPERLSADLTNTFEQLTTLGWDKRLEQTGIPPPVLDDGSGGNWTRAREIRLAWLTNAAIARAFYANPNPASIRSWSVDRSIELYGLPSSMPVKSGPFIVQRFQRVSLQLWVENVPGMPAAGSVVGILGGDLAKQAGLVPPAAAQPGPPN